MRLIFYSLIIVTVLSNMNVQFLLKSSEKNDFFAFLMSRTHYCTFTIFFSKK